MTVVHYRKEPTKKVINFGNKTYWRTNAACGVYSEVPSPEQGMQHTNNIDDVTCQKCLDTLVIFDLSTPKVEEEAPAEEPVEFFDSENEPEEWS